MAFLLRPGRLAGFELTTTLQTLVENRHGIGGERFVGELLRKSQNEFRGFSVDVRVGDERGIDLFRPEHANVVRQLADLRLDPLQFAPGRGAGGVCVAAGTVGIVDSDISYNQAVGGYGDDGGTDGQGVGGGVYNLGTFLFDDLTLIAHNHASTSNDDCFGC